MFLSSVPTFDEFAEIVDEEVRLLPSYALEGLEGGVLVDPSAYLHPARVADDLYILGTYSMGITGHQIVLYYGSFMAASGFCSREALRTRIRETLRHEVLHHLETRAGLYYKGSLIEEDRERMRRYYESHMNEKKD